ncbi:hypothetical protein Poli38472_007843 [Pythium oligandrum]|uniref:PX domain-containing protein n=1 Tax=Pythium oligandrum TaxID=41045 RepID=A0A8K1CT64_PYTOL|nr:hypothetical protein Poli38472_007843 [Pythium oligandrum]|eukprot:TMW68171.1 hypothetical protein Poli38472_007843 [Pythium oligandrum]
MSMLTPSFHLESRALRPVAARIVSYGRTSKVEDPSIDKNTTLYVMRVARSGEEWFVARRYSEFRVLYDTLRSVLAKPHNHRSRSQPVKRKHVKQRMCPQCRELATHYGSVTFPRRFRLRSGLASSKDKIESSRVLELNEFLQLIIQMTQGLLASEDDDSDDEDEDDVTSWEAPEDEEPEDRCDALSLIRQFLMVKEHDQVESKTGGVPKPTRHPHQLHRRSSSGSSVTKLRVQEMDVRYKRQSSPPSPWMFPYIESRGDASPRMLDEDDDFHAMFLGDYALPADDAVIHIQGSETPSVHGHTPFRSTESMRVISRLR